MDLPEQSVDPALYKAAVQSKIDPYKFYQTSLNQLLTPNKNIILHVYLENQRTEPESTDFVDRILEMCPPLLLQRNMKGEIPLHFAASYDLPKVAGVLIDRAKALPFDLEIGLTKAKKMLRMTNEEKDTALHVAAQNFHSSVVIILTEADLNFYIPPILMEKLHFVSEEVIDIILKKCKLMDYSGPNGRTALHAAVMHNYQAAVATDCAGGRASTSGTVKRSSSLSSSAPKLLFN
ncbi:unnamed protein product [Dovyalis caffra]|uniref:Uncharacterized protein n=1 Tax=Dovyalis caffra TaxID=77055 RepID=A0AAV1SFX2_9ROSI|nr:unnamed protein product [Dovyalis caffra]